MLRDLNMDIMSYDIVDMEGCGTWYSVFRSSITRYVDVNPYWKTVKGLIKPDLSCTIPPLRKDMRKILTNLIFLMTIFLARQFLMKANLHSPIYF